MTTRRSFSYARRQTDRMIAGVAGGLADTLGVSVAYVRAAFLTLATIWGLGALLYLGFWLAAFDRVEDKETEPVSSQQAIGLAVAFLGLMLLMALIGWWPNTAVVITAGALAFGTAALTDSSRPGPLAALLDPSVESAGRFRIILGVGLLIGGLAVFTSSVGPVFEFGVVALAVALTGLGIAVAFGPWVRRLLADLGEERSERIRQEERAEVAAHLHDSVLQTLALIQRTDDPGRMSMLARHQEGELRDWLYGETPLDGVDLISTALKNAAHKIEQDHQVIVDVVTVGDHSVDEAGRALVGASTEAMVNAAKHAGVERLSLYLEVDETEMAVYVTDHGKGFDTTAIPEDRKGLTDSVKARVQKVGGTVSIDSEPGEGTEVVLRMPVGAE